MHRYKEVFLIAIAVSAILTPIVRLLAFKWNALDHPKAHGIHHRPVPRIGGIAIYIAFVVGALWTMDLSNQLKGILVGSTMIFIAGLCDDFFKLKASIRLLIQGVALGIMMFKYGVILDAFNHVGLNALFTVVGIIGITNAVNFLDNMDGLSSGLIAISSLTVTVIAWMTHQIWLGYLSAALMGASCGFLIFNLKKAHVFMGDSGATFLGFTLASIAVMADWSYHLPVTLAVPVLILGVPILDMTLITILRIKEAKVMNLKQWIDYTGKDHFSHRVMRLGLGERGAVFTLWGVQAVFCAIAILVIPQKDTAGIIGLALYVILAAGTILFFRKRRWLIINFSKRTQFRPKRTNLSVNKRVAAPSEKDRIPLNV
ncbi:MAG: undecaprenyl/decaprenyl-phosphate alpha-N-acetylglucosaminyl 1-phosphate transferase [Candidatus Omnitrophica bacterium]|nr:undecaprenyl/decaprenyl-phosphate alpha-N-acetylglucosaminyl 1-phosphate transferase [Candidatus Omnitrophota bacterium]